MDDKEQRREQMRQRLEERRKKAAGVLMHAVNDADFRQQLLENPRAAFGVPVDPDSPQPPEAVVKIRRELLQEIVDRAVSDLPFRRQLGEHPRQALQEGGFGPRLEQLRAEMPQPDVKGFGTGWSLTSGGGWGYFWDPGAPGWG
ncbi:MAG: hypothetical protein ACR2GA_01510 [Chloroflexota bacterium]